MNRILLRYELLGLLRDTRTVLLSVVLPVLLLPLLLMSLQRLGQQTSLTAEKDDRYLVGRPLVSKQLEPLFSEVFSDAPFQQSLTRDSDSQLSDGSVDVAVEVGKPEKESVGMARSIVKAFPELAQLINKESPGRPVVELSYRADRDRSVRAFLAARDQLLDYRDRLVDGYFESKSAEVGVKFKTRDVSTEQERAARKYGPALSSFMILILLGGGSVAALDSLAGEKERGTLTTLFLSSVPRRTMIWTKFTAVALISLGIALVQALNLLFYAVVGPFALPFEPSASQGLAMLLGLTVLFLAQALFTAAILLYLSARSGSFKEAQLFFFPLFLVSFALSLSGLMPGLVSRSVLSLIPLAGPGVLIPEILASRTDLAMMLLQVLVHLGAAYLLLESTVRYVSKEEFLSGQPPTTGQDLVFERFSRRALPLYALLGAALMVIPSNFAGLSTLLGQGLFNQVVLFGLGPLLLLRLYRQRLSEAVPMRPVSVAIVGLCLCLIPLGQVAATGLSHLLAPILPAPTQAMEEMMKLLDLENTPPWRIYLLIGILPGIFEEFAFRGVLLHALHKRFSPWALATVVALIFGMFHLSFFRVVPTAYLGFVLGLVTLATGSVWPAMLIHIGNNSLAVFAMFRGWDFEHLSSVTYLTCFLAQVAAVGLILRWGKGYPGTVWSGSVPDSGSGSEGDQCSGSGAEGDQRSR